MNYKNLNIKHSYISYGEDNITAALIVPALKCTKIYRRSVGFFSSSVFELIMDGITNLVRNKGKIELIASPRLSDDDINAINSGYDEKDKIVSERFSKEFIDEISRFGDKELILLAELIARDVLNIKIAVTHQNGMYHDKLGILEDFEGNNIVFYGSANSSKSGYRDNYEKIRVVNSWTPGQEESVRDEIDEFESLWKATNPYVDVYEFKESARKKILEIISERKNKENADSPIELRDYQEKAIEAWIKNGYKGFYVMATGTGKTWTAIFSAKELLESKDVDVVICAPYKHLVKQWAEDVSRAFSNAKIILVSSENPGWEREINQEIIRRKYGKAYRLIIISTIASFGMDRFRNVIEKSENKKLLIVDEAHRFKDKSEYIRNTYSYMLGLSATPFSGKSLQSGKELMDFFGGQVFNLPIEEALDKGFLVPYNYYPIFINATDEDENEFKKYTQMILSCFKNGVCVDPEGLNIALRGRLRCISMAEKKQVQIDYILSNVKERDHVVVYCGDGKLYDSNSGEELRHIQAVKRILTKHEYKPSQFTAKENMIERMQLVSAFNKGEITALAAIRCLDEGINIPSIKSALILSSNDDYREFVQRRGRILRKYEGKKEANIYDVVVLPSLDNISWARIEFRRYYEYAKLAQNSSVLLDELERLCSDYNLNMEDIDVFEYDDLEVDTDE